MKPRIVFIFSPHMCCISPIEM